MGRLWAMLLTVTVTVGCGSTLAPSPQPTAPMVLSGAVLLGGQSNAVLLRDLVLPQSTNVVQGGTSITAWGPTQPLGIELRAKAGHGPYRVFVWWQGESDGDIDPALYASLLRSLIADVRVAGPVPVRIVGIAPNPALIGIRSALRSVAGDAGNGYIDTDDLKVEADSPAHFQPYAFPIVAGRIAASIQ